MPAWLLQAADASAKRHEQLVAENQKLERDYERFRRRKNLQERVAVSGWFGCAWMSSLF
jgi:hypothetical protein